MATEHATNVANAIGTTPFNRLHHPPFDAWLLQPLAPLSLEDAAKVWMVLSDLALLLAVLLVYRATAPRWV